MCKAKNKEFYLPNTVDELKKDRRSVRVIMFVITVSDTVVEFVAVAQPLLLYEDLEPLQGSVVGVKEEHRERTQLGRPVPSIATVDYNTGLVVFYLNRQNIISIIY